MAGPSLCAEAPVVYAAVGMRIVHCICLLAAAGAVPLRAASEERFDVVIVSGSSGGVGAAIGAGRMGVRVALIEDTPVLGGMLANGVSNIDSYSYESLSGVFEEFRQAVKQHYLPLFDTDPFFRAADRMPRHIDGRSFAAHEAREGGRWEPHVADAIFKKMIAALPNVSVYYRRYATGVVRSGRRVIGVTTSSDTGDPITFYAKAIVDATHEGDIAAWAGAPYRVGREARSRLEPHAGQIFYFNRTAELLPGSTGRQDPGVVSYGLRLCIQNYPPGDTTHVLREPPPGYNKADYLAGGYKAAPYMPHGKAEMNVYPRGSEMQEANWRWPEATRSERLQLYRDYKNHALGYLYFLQHEMGYRYLGLPDDEFADNGHVPYRVFVREARRIEGDALMTESDINPFIEHTGLIPTLQPASIAVGEYPLDSKPVRTKTDLTTPDKGDGDFYLVNASTAFQVPYGAILPRGVDGLLVPVALSATHVAFSAVRMDPTWTVIGQAAGVAAALSAKAGKLPRELSVTSIQDELLKQRAKLVFFWDVPADRPDAPAIQKLALKGIVKGYPDRTFRPDAPLTRAETAALLVRAFDLWTSVSDVHFKDVPYTHWAFRQVETLFDHHALAPLGVSPRWPRDRNYDAATHMGYLIGQSSDQFLPDRPVSEKELEALLARGGASAGDDRPITRGRACTRILDVLGW